MKKLFFILFLIILLGCSTQPFVKIGDQRIIVEVADDNAERAIGLMSRTSLEDNYGMIFVFPEENEVTFWMKNTLIPLDMIFISEDFKILDIKTAEPCKENTCQLYGPVKNVKYVLEVNAGFAIRNNIKVGDLVY